MLRVKKKKKRSKWFLLKRFGRRCWEHRRQEEALRPDSSGMGGRVGQNRISGPPTGEEGARPYTARVKLHQGAL